MSLLTRPAGRRSKFVVLALLVLVAGALASQAGKLEDVQSADAASSLPRGAESREVARLLGQYPSGEVSPAVTVFRPRRGAERRRPPANRALAHAAERRSRSLRRADAARAHR